MKHDDNYIFIICQQYNPVLCQLLSGICYLVCVWLAVGMGQKDVQRQWQFFPSQFDAFECLNAHLQHFKWIPKHSLSNKVRVKIENGFELYFLTWLLALTITYVWWCNVSGSLSALVLPHGNFQAGHLTLLILCTLPIL